MPAAIAPILVALSLLGNSPALLLAPRQDQTAKPADTIVPIPLPANSLSDTDYKNALSTLLSDPAKRPGVYQSLALNISRDEAPPHVGVIVQVLSSYLTADGEPKEMVMPLRILGKCGKAAQPLLAKVLTLTINQEPSVRAAACEALGGMYYAPPDTPPTCPPSVTTVLVHILETDTDRETERAASVALGRCRVATPAVIHALSEMTGIGDGDVALGAVNAAMALGTEAHEILPALKIRLADPETAANTAPAIIAIAKPQEAADMFADVLTTATELPTRQVIVYYAGQLPKTTVNTTALAAAIKSLIAAPPTTKNPVPAEDTYALRVAAAKTYYALSTDIVSAAGGLANVIADSAAPAETRRNAILVLSGFGSEVVKIPAVLPALNAAMGDENNALQGAAVNVLFKFGGPAAKSVAPRLSELLLAAWKSKDDARVYSLINAIYRIGPAAKASAAPVLRQIIAGEPKNSTNARYAQIALDKITAKP